MWMEKLRSQAISAGGSVVSHLGNHEWMNLLGSSSFVDPGLKVFNSSNILSLQGTGGKLANNFTNCVFVTWV